MGVIFEFAQARFEEAIAESKRFIKAPVSYIMQEQPVRTAVTLELLEFVRPGKDVEWEHRIVEQTGRPFRKRR
jgi:hypothetical protein